MIPSKNYSQSQNGNSILISIKPRFADLIISGSKKVELRRAAPKRPVQTMAIYSSAPVQAIVALVEIKEIIEANKSELWEIAKINGGGVNREELREYYFGRKSGFAIMLGNVDVFEKPIDPKIIFEKFYPPQSFQYLTNFESNQIKSFLKIGRKRWL